MKLTERKKMILINIVCVLALAVILWPLLVISKYNYPSADDWSYGVNTYRAIQNHEGVFQFLKTVYETVRNDENRKKVTSDISCNAAGNPGGRGQFCHQRIHHVSSSLLADPVPDLPEGCFSQNMGHNIIRDTQRVEMCNFTVDNGPD